MNKNNLVGNWLEEKHFWQGVHIECFDFSERLVRWRTNSQRWVGEYPRRIFCFFCRIVWAVPLFWPTPVIFSGGLCMMPCVAIYCHVMGIQFWFLSMNPCRRFCADEPSFLRGGSRSELNNRICYRHIPTFGLFSFFGMLTCRGRVLIHSHVKNWIWPDSPVRTTFPLRCGSRLRRCQSFSLCTGTILRCHGCCGYGPVLRL